MLNPRLHHEAKAGSLLAIVELKWLLAGHGLYVHVERLQNDPEYARRVLDAAAALPGAALHGAIERVRLALQPV